MAVAPPVSQPAGRPARRPAQGPPIRRPLGQILVESGAVTPENLERALSLRSREASRLGDILLAYDWVREADLTAALSRQYGVMPIDLRKFPPDARLIEEMGVTACLRAAAVPVRRLGGATVIATARPDAFAALSRRLPAGFGQPVMALCSETALHDAILATRNRHLAARAETRVPCTESCRHWYGTQPRRNLLAGMLLLGATAAFLPVVILTILTLCGLFSLVATSALKAAAAWTTLRRGRHQPPPDRPTIARMPVVSVLVPLFHEDDIAPRLVQRLQRLTYPRELLDICLVTEADDDKTQNMLARSDLPSWIRVITVPAGSLKTKPRALNFALDFCRGTIVGVWDAEDAPAPDQLTRVVRRFHERGSDLACLQGVLDFYNSRSNWFARAFTIEYATWFRLVLPGLDRLGLVVPLGGTTVFFRRDALEKLGAWDAHNVTEDADLGFRLARHGYRTELIDTVTFEEANCRFWPWVRQRSRWLKGYAMTWTTHMRAPRLLLRQLGWWRFTGVQMLFLGTLAQFLLVPLMWSFWLVVLGLGHPLGGVFPGWAMLTAGLLFAIAEVLNIVLGMIGSAQAGKRWLWGWVPTLHFYYPLAVLAAYKALFEMVVRPFYWDKTCHGLEDRAEVTPNPDATPDQGA